MDYKIKNRKSKMIKYFITLFLSVVPFFFANGQIIKVNAQFDSSAMWIGDQMRLRVEMERQSDVRVEFPAWLEALPRSIEVLDIYPVDSMQTSDGMFHYFQEVLITSFDSGRHVLPPLRFPFVIDGIVDTIATRPAYLYVYRIPLEEEDGITDIKPIYELPVGWADIFPWVWRIWLSLLVVALIAFGIYAYNRRRNNQPIFGAPKPADPPHIVALRELDRLRGEKLWQTNRTKDYYIRLSDVVRNYIEGRFGVAAMEMTSDEILAGLQNVGFEDNNLVGRLSKLFTLADLVKFAKAQPLPDENETSMLDGYLFVNNTKIDEQKDIEPNADDADNSDIRELPNDNNV